MAKFRVEEKLSGEVVQKEPKFYTFNQNNSGGSFRDPAVYVIIEARSTDEANYIAENHGIYFNGCSNGRDCSCCGDRWYEASDYDAAAEPKIYDKTVEEHMEKNGHWSSGEDFPEILVIYLDGTQKRYFIEE